MQHSPLMTGGQGICFLNKKVSAVEIKEAWAAWKGTKPMPSPGAAFVAMVKDEHRRHHAWTMRRMQMLKAGAFDKKWVP